jgi:hypothetical protein
VSDEERFTIWDGGPNWGWHVRDNRAGRDVLTNKLDESTARALADELNADPPKLAPVYAVPPYPKPEGQKEKEKADA